MTGKPRRNAAGLAVSADDIGATAIAGAAVRIALTHTDQMPTSIKGASNHVGEFYAN